MKTEKDVPADAPGGDRPPARTGFLLIVCCLFLLGCDAPPRLPALADNATILAFGDSLTYGTGAAASASYPARLQALTGHTVINAGVPGEVSATGLRRLAYLLKQKPVPDLLILCHGANDILRHLDMQQAERNLQAMIDLATARGIAVLLIAVPHYSLTLSPHPMYARLATRNRLPLVRDALRAILLKTTLKADLIHPNEKGYQILAETIYHDFLKPER